MALPYFTCTKKMRRYPNNSKQLLHLRKLLSKKTIATGSILPLEEVLIKPNISGVIEAVYVKGGDLVSTGDLIAKIKVVPNISALNDAKNNVDQAKINVSDQMRNFERQETLFGKNVISAA